jgi:uncharacterized membrane protein YkgB
LFARLALALSFAWFGAMNFTAVGTQMLEGWIEGHAMLSGLAGQAASAARALGIYQLVMAALIGAPLPTGSFRRIGLAMLAIHCGLALTLMLTNPVWLEAEGGFPAIGAGQDIVKYLAILGLALWAASFESTRMFSSRYSQMRLWSLPVMWAGLVLVLGWIGAMKATASEAAGIEPLVGSHLFFSWLPPLAGTQGTSYAIGAIELVTVLALTGYWFSRWLYRIGLAMAAVTFVLTLSFLVSFSGAWDADLGGFPALSPAGHFLLKDLPLLAVCLALFAETGPGGTRRRR